VVDQLLSTGWSWLIVEVNSGENALKEDEYRNLRAEMWGKLKDWLRKGVLPRDEELKADLRGPRIISSTPETASSLKARKT
jgi:phage terminase large subunit